MEILRREASDGPRASAGATVACSGGPSAVRNRVEELAEEADKAGAAASEAHSLAGRQGRQEEEDEEEEDATPGIHGEQHQLWPAYAVGGGAVERGRRRCNA